MFFFIGLIIPVIPVVRCKISFKAYAQGFLSDKMALIYVYLSYQIVKIHINRDCPNVKKCVPLQRISGKCAILVNISCNIDE